MKNSLEKKMKAAQVTFKSKAEIKSSELSDLLDENRRFLIGISESATSGCRLNKGSDMLPSLFKKCFELCEKSFAISENSLFEHFEKEKTDGLSAELIPLAFTCALAEYAAVSVRSGSAKKLEYALDSLRLLSETDFEQVLERISLTEKILLRDPSGIYEKMSESTKKSYRRAIAVKAIKSGKAEEEIAENALVKAKESGSHIGEFILDNEVNQRLGNICITMGVIMPFLTALIIGFFCKNAWISVFSFFPLWELFRIPVERTIIKCKKPNFLPRMRCGDSKALITLSTLMPTAEKIDELKEKLEQHYLSNGSDKVKICCLTDFKAADAVRKAADKRLLCAAEKIIDELNQKHGGGFILAVRPRSYSETQNEYIGKERKRGAITELVRAIKGNSMGFIKIYGDSEGLCEVKYLIAVDWDTEPYFGAADKLIAVAEHPLNQPAIKDGRVVKGYGLLVPEVSNSLKSKFATGFTKIMAGNTGFSSYDSFACEKYQLFFGESIFGGKGLINVDAYFKTLDKSLPRERVLSHDTIESGYLRAAYVADAQFAESFPETSEAYFKRLHRWVRGDFQNIGFIFGKNPMNKLSRYKIFDNLRRDIHSVFCISAIIFSAFEQGNAGVILALISLFSLSCEWIYSAVFSARNGFSQLSFSGASSPSFELALRGFVAASFAVKEAYFCLDAAVKALWRSFISGDHLLEWETSANALNSNKIKGFAVSCLPSVVVAALLIVFGLPIHRLAAIIFLFDIPLTFFSGIKLSKAKGKFTSKEKSFLFSKAEMMWNFFDDFWGQENNYLPPDNVRFSPSKAVCKKTSPTNIGLMLVSFLAARDFGFISSQELCSRLNLSLLSIEKLEKYSGNLLNWYSTETLEAISPRFVSTVDSGNFLCCLTALKEGLNEYVEECGALKNIIKRVEKIINKTDLSVLYNDKRRLFYVGLYPDNREKTKSCYDLFMSEMRMTSYLAVARKEVPPNHWGELGRIGVEQGRYKGLASWTGTTFEYFMPELFIPSPRGSIVNEALNFCVYIQRKRAGKRPFGISESCFYAFDSEMNYRYKAHGVADLALCTADDSETVVSPYSSFLTLACAPKSSLKNLEKLEKAGALGKYGFYEAVDYSNGINFIRSFMAHHVGMSFVSVANALFDNRMQRRFMSDLHMKGAKSLLEEKMPCDLSVFSGDKKKSQNLTENPKAAVYSNGKLTQCFLGNGAEMMIFDGEYLSSEEKMEPVIAYIETENGRMYFNQAKESAKKWKYSADLRKTEAVSESWNKNISLKTEVTVFEKQNTVKRVYTVENKDKSCKLKGKIEILLDFEGFETIEEKEYLTLKHCNSQCFLRAEVSGSDKEVTVNNCISVDIELEAEEKTSVEFIVSAGESRESIADSSKQKSKHVSRIFADDSLLTVLTAEILSRVPDRETSENLVVAIKTGEENVDIYISPFLQINKKLRSIGIKNDLVIMFDSGSSIENEIRNAIKKEESELMLGVKGGIHLVDLSACSEQNAKLIVESSCFYLDYEQDKKL